MNIEAILAHDRNYVIGRGDDIPWHHSGDFKRFKSITMGHNLLMGAKTFLGIAKNYSTPGFQVLHGRHIFIVGKPRNPVKEFFPREILPKEYDHQWIQLRHDLSLEIDKLGVDKRNITIYLDGPPKDVLTRIQEKHLTNGETLFIAGGANTYANYIYYASKIHQTIIDTEVDGDNLVKLDPLVNIYLKTIDDGSEDGSEVCNGLNATYKTHIV